jgi:type IV pilus assembly protein PilO
MREIVFFLVLAAIPTGAYLWVFKPANERIEEQRESIKSKSNKLADLRRAAKGIEELDGKVQEIMEAVEFFESKLPSQHEIHRVLDQVAKIAREHRLETKLFKTEKPKPFASYSEQPIKMEVHGGFDDYYQFLLELERIPRITKISEMELESEDTHTGYLEAKFTLSIFFDHGRTGIGAGRNT